MKVILNRINYPGWKLVRFMMKKSIITYESNFGDSMLTQSQFPRLSFTIEIKRIGWRPYLNYFIGFFVTAFLCIIGFLWKNIAIAFVLHCV